MSAATKAPLAAADSRTSLTLPRFRTVIWLMPAAYVLHIIEEYAGNFPAWVDDDVHGTFNYFGFDLNNVMFMIILVTLVTVNFRRSSALSATALVAFASANLFWDALFHVGLTAALDRYSPGLVTAAVLYIPISILVGVVTVSSRVISVRRFVLAVAGGALIFGFVVWYGLFHFAV